MRLAGDDLPIPVASQPGIGNMITRAQILAKDCLSLVSVVTKNRHVIVNPTLYMLEFDRTGISGWQRRDIRNQLELIHGASFFIRENGIVGEILLPGSLVAGNYGVVQLLRSPNQFVLTNGCVSLSSGSEVWAAGENKEDSEEFHNRIQNWVETEIKTRLSFTS